MEDLEQQVHHYIRQIEITKREMVEAESKLSYAKKRLAMLKKDYSAIKVDKKKERSIQRLQKRIHDERNNLGKAEAANTKIRRRIDTLRRSNNALTSSCRALEVEAATLQTQLDVMEKQRQDAIEDCAALKVRVRCHHCLLAYHSSFSFFNFLLSLSTNQNPPTIGGDR